jgi:hypothetical protein
MSINWKSCSRKNGSAKLLPCKIWGGELRTGRWAHFFNTARTASHTPGLKNSQHNQFRCVANGIVPLQLGCLQTSTGL